MNFRVFCYNVWLAHQDEILAWEKKPPCYSAAEYFKKYKWTLREMYRKYDKNPNSLETFR